MERPEETAGLVAAAQEGDRAALESLFVAFYPRVLRIAEIRLGVRLRRLFDPDDIAQSVFGRAHRGLPKFRDRGPGSFAGWLGTLVDHTIQDKARWLEAAKRRGAPRPQVPPPGGERETSARSPSRLASKEEDLQALHRAMHALPERDRRAIELRTYLGLQASEVGAALGVSEEAAKKIYARALERLSARMVQPG